MRIFALVFGVPAALAFMAVSMGCNWVFLSGFGTTAAEFYLLSGLSVSVDVLKALAPFWIMAAREAHRPVAALGAALLLVLCLTLSFLSALGFAAGSRGTATGGREAVSSDYRTASGDLADIEGQLKALPFARPQGVIEADLARQKQDRLWSSSKSCADARSAASRKFCKGVETLRAELAAALEAARLREKDGKLKERMAALRSKGAGLESDPQASLVSAFLSASVGSVSVGDVQSGVSVLVAVLVEFGAAFGLFFALTVGRPDKTAAKGNAQVKLAYANTPVRRSKAVAVRAEPVREFRRVRL